MKHTELLNSNLLEIIFENRNRDYGAYAIRKGYNNRLLIALCTGLFLFLFLIFVLSSGKKESTEKPQTKTNEGILLKTIEMPKEKVKLPESPKVPPKKNVLKKVATVKYTTPPAIKKDSEVKQAMVATQELEGKEIADQTIEGEEADNTVVLNNKPAKTPETTATSGPSQPDFIAIEKDPQFPGGIEAMKLFMAKNLNTPGNLDEGEKKVVRIKFKVEKDGTVSTFEIVTSGGSDFDKEVLRVCKKMPRWLPAVQNGINVPVNYLLPVTFIGPEE